jgi:hypothetical protein
VTRSHPVPRSSRWVALLVAATVLIPGCGVRGLNFVEDERVTITSPRDRAEVTLPLTVTWTARDFAVTGRDGSERPDAGFFGIYVDRAPQPPDQSQAWLVRNDARCKSDPACPDEAFLAQRDIHSATQMSFLIERLPQPSTNAPRRREFHEVTIVLLDGRGERIGESAFVRQFEVDRDL